MIISLKSNKTRKFVAEHLSNRDILTLIGLKPIKVEFMERSSTYKIVDHPNHRLTEKEVKRYFHVIEGYRPVEKSDNADEEKAEIPQFPMFATPRVTVHIKECSVNSDTLEEFIKQLRSKFE